MTEQAATVAELPEPIQARVRRILARSPADWRAGKVTPGQDSGTWIIELLDGKGQLMAELAITELPNEMR